MEGESGMVLLCILWRAFQAAMTPHLARLEGSVHILSLMGVEPIDWSRLKVSKS